MSFFGIDGPEFIVLAIVAMLIIGPVRAARALVQLKDFVGKLREYSARLREHSPDIRLADALGLQQELSKQNIDLDSLNLAELDPRKVIKEAVKEEMEAWAKQAKSVTSAVSVDALTKPVASRSTEPAKSPVQQEVSKAGIDGNAVTNTSHVDALTSSSADQQSPAHADESSMPDGEKSGLTNHAEHDSSTTQPEAGGPDTQAANSTADASRDEHEPRNAHADSPVSTTTGPEQANNTQASTAGRSDPCDETAGENETRPSPARSSFVTEPYVRTRKPFNLDDPELSDHASSS